jgi:hypothetical protein
VTVGLTAEDVEMSYYLVANLARPTISESRRRGSSRIRKVTGNDNFAWIKLEYLKRVDSFARCPPSA